MIGVKKVLNKYGLDDYLTNISKYFPIAHFYYGKNTIFNHILYSFSLPVQLPS